MVLQSDFLRTDLRLLIFNIQVFFEIAMGLRGLKEKRIANRSLTGSEYYNRRVQVEDLDDYLLYICNALPIPA